MEMESTLMCSQDTATGPYSKPDKSNICPELYFRIPVSELYKSFVYCVKNIVDELNFTSFFPVKKVKWQCCNEK
jgi:hypothetical protein